MKIAFWILFAVLCMSIGIYPILYLITDDRIGLLRSKSDVVLNSGLWRLGFYVHIVCGGLALSVGWSQFVKSWRTQYLRLHRILGKLYVLMVFMSGVAAVCIAPLSSTGWVASLGFGSLGVVWLYFTLRAYQSVRTRDFRSHEYQMIYSYSACLSAVTLRLWLPLLLVAFRLDFSLAYPIVAWLAWIPNLLGAHLIISRMRTSAAC
ncbi:MAG: DUF2306 domain-containing protein [Planctomyces sp.]|nr:DUF2306 domain-containing protein [Planctomyces sp.]